VAVVGVQTVRLDPPPPEGFRPERIALSLGGQYAALAGVVVEGGGAGASGEEGEPRPLLLCVDLAGLARYRGRDIEGVRCRSHVLGGARLEQQRSLRVRQLRWHPRSAFHIAALFEDSLTGAAAFHIYHVGRDSVLPEQEYGLFPGGPRGFGLFDYDAPSSEMLRDFAWAPESGWGLFSVLFLGSAGSTFTLGPVAPFGALYPRAEVRALLESLPAVLEGEDGDRAALWLSQVFPDVPGGTSAEAEAQAFVLQEAAPALRGPLPIFPERQGGGAEGADACSLAVGSPGPGCTVVSQADSEGTVTVQLLAGNLEPLWEDSLVDCICAPGKALGGGAGAAAEALAHVTCDLALRSSGPNQLSLLAVESVQLGRPSASGGKIPDAQLLVDPLSGGHLYCHHAQGLHLITLPWAPGVVDWLGVSAALAGDGESEGEGEEDGEQELRGPDLPPPVISTLMYGETEPVGTALVTDRLGGGEVVCFDRPASGKGEGACTVRFIPTLKASRGVEATPAAAPSSGKTVEGTLGDDSGTWDAREELREVESWYKELTEGPPRNPLPVAAQPMAASTPEGQRYLHECVASLSKTHIERCHRIHERCLGRESQLREEFERQQEKKDEVALKLRAELQKAKSVKARVARAKALHKNLAARVKILAELDSSRPMELSAGEVRAMSDFQGLQGTYDKLGSRIKECKRRSEALVTSRTPEVALASPAPGSLGRAPVQPALPTRARKPPRAQQLLVQTADTVRDNVALARDLAAQLGPTAGSGADAPA